MKLTVKEKRMESDSSVFASQINKEAISAATRRAEKIAV
jgi:hypothetical protein